MTADPVLSACHQEIERLQCEAYAATGRAPRRDSADQSFRDHALAEGLLDDMLARRATWLSPARGAGLRAEVLESWARAAQVPLPTPLEDRWAYVGMLPLVDDIEGTLPGLGLPSLPRPAFGTLPTGDINAVCRPVPGTHRHIILFETDLVPFLYRISQVVARALPASIAADKSISFSCSVPGLRKSVARDQRVLDRFHEIVRCFVVGETPPLPDSHFKEEPHRTLAGILSNAMDVFAMGHEYGHLLLEQGIAPGASIAVSGAPQAVLEIPQGTWQDELGADWHAFELTAGSQRKHGVSWTLGIVAIDCFLRCAEIVEGAFALVKGRGRWHLDSPHPPVALRRGQLKAWLQFRAQKQAGDTVNGLTECLAAALEIMKADTYRRLDREFVGRLGLRDVLFGL